MNTYMTRRRYSNPSWGGPESKLGSPWTWKASGWRLTSSSLSSWSSISSSSLNAWAEWQPFLTSFEFYLNMAETKLLTYKKERKINDSAIATSMWQLSKLLNKEETIDNTLGMFFALPFSHRTKLIRMIQVPNVWNKIIDSFQLFTFSFHS